MDFGKNTKIFKIPNSYNFRHSRPFRLAISTITPKTTIHLAANNAFQKNTVMKQPVRKNADLSIHLHFYAKTAVISKKRNPIPYRK